MAINVSGNGVVIGDHVTEYPVKSQKEEHATLIREHYGDRCPEPDRLCACCHLWYMFDHYWLLVEEVVSHYRTPLSLSDLKRACADERSNRE